MKDKFSYEKALKKIEEDQKCIPKFCCCPSLVGPPGSQGPQGEPGPQGPQGEPGPVSNNGCCFCVEQMANIINQIITLYPNDTLVINMESGNSASGVPASIQYGPNEKSGIFQLKKSIRENNKFIINLPNCFSKNNKCCI